jgi:hypothetical protein
VERLAAKNDNAVTGCNPHRRAFHPAISDGPNATSADPSTTSTAPP